MSNDEEHAPSAAASENEDDEAEADSDREQLTRSRKRSKTSLTKVGDLYAVSQRRQALSAKANKGKFARLRAEKPARANAALTTKNSGKDFVCGVLFVSLVFGVQKPLNSTAKWFCCCTSDCDWSYDLTGTDGGKSRSKTSIYTHLRQHAIPRDENNGRIVNLEQTKTCVNTGSTPNAPSSSGLSAGVSSSGQPSAAMPGLTSPGAGQSFCFCVRPFFFGF